MERAERVAMTAWTLLLRARGREVMAALREAGLPAVLVKGPVTAAWLYPDGRTYRDIDVLVRPRDFHRATELLGALGYTNPAKAHKPSTISPNETHLVSPAGVCLDLHRGLIGVPPDRDEEAFDRFEADGEPFDFGGLTVRTLGLTARLMHLALHTAQNGAADTRALEDLRRGLAAEDDAAWSRAAALADDLGAAEAFAAGLRVDPDGRALADRLGLPDEMSVEQRLRASSASVESLAIARIMKAHGPRERAALVWHHLFPHRDLLLTGAPAGSRVLALRVANVGSVVRRLPGAVSTYYRAAHRD